MFVTLLVQLVDFCRRHAWFFVLGAVALALGATWFAADHLAFDTNTAKLIDERVPWRQREITFDRAFPQNVNLLAIVIDGATPDLSEDATAALAQRLAAQPQLFKSVRRPDGGVFFEKNGLLFLPTSEVQETTERIIAAQPLIGSLAADPSLRGMFGALALVLEGVRHGQAELSALDRPFPAIAAAIEGVLAGKPVPLSWSTLFTGRAPDPAELRRFILAQPALDYSALSPARPPRMPCGPPRASSA
ncbi:MAG: hypothetical protein WDO24_13490 [Pseudomonadota bacterium]